MQQLFEIFGNWTWFIIGLVLLLVELLAPGVVFMWLGLAAIGVGLADLLAPLSWQMEVTLFAVLAVLFLAIGRPIVMRRMNKTSEQPDLNQRTRQLIGKSYVLQEPITAGKGRLSVNDTLWRIKGPDTPAGTWVTITGADGLELIVEPKTG